MILILDVDQSGRHLVLAAPILSLGLPTLILLNMADDLAVRGGEVDVAALAQELGAPVALISASKGTGIDRYPAIPVGDRRDAGCRRNRRVLNSRCCTMFRNAGNGRPTWAQRASYRAPAPPLWTRRLDAVFLHPVAGPLVFAAVVVAVFPKHLFLGAARLWTGCRPAITISGHWLTAVLPDTSVALAAGRWHLERRRLGDRLSCRRFCCCFCLSEFWRIPATWRGRRSSRTAPWRSSACRAKSFIPLLSAYACAVPAIMATRVIENKRDRMATIMIAPFMTCSARLPVYTLIIAAFVPNIRCPGAFLSLPAATMLGFMCWVSWRPLSRRALLKSTILKSERTPFHSGNAALSLAHPAVAGVCGCRSREGFSAPRRNRDSAGGDRCCGCWRICRCTTARRPRSTTALPE